MLIHVVQRGESLYAIGRTYGVSVEEIATANEIPDPSRLVIGQALVIPVEGSFHIVQPGESLFSIANRYGTTVAALANTNGLTVTTMLQVGQRLQIPQKSKPLIDTMLYVEPRTPVTEAMIAEVRDKTSGTYLTYLAMFSYQVQRDGSLYPPTTDNIPQIASSNGVANAMVISNLENYRFEPSLAHDIFTDLAAQNRLFGNAIQIANEVGYKDIHFDFELLYPEDRQLYNNFLSRARDRFHAAGLTVSSAVAPKPSNVMTGIYGAHDYASTGGFNGLCCTYDVRMGIYVQRTSSS